MVGVRPTIKIQHVELNYWMPQLYYNYNIIQINYNGIVQYIKNHDIYFVLNICYVYYKSQIS